MKLPLLHVLLLFAGTALCAPVQEDDSHVLKWESVLVGPGAPVSTEARLETVPVTIEETVRVNLPSDLVNQAREYIHAEPHHLRKRLIFGEDDRKRIDPAKDGLKFPFTAVVRVSTGCSGLLITKKHVLTAAHCLHDGNNYLSSALFFLRAGYLERDGRTNWFFAKRFFVPSQWKNTTARGAHQYREWDDYDVAVIEMNENLGSLRAFIPPGLSSLVCANAKSLHGAGSTIQFVSFPDDKSNKAMWFVSTQVKTESPHLLYFTGDAWHGSSGAGLYTWDVDDATGEWERRVVGVLSGNRDTVPFASEQGNFNVGARLNAVNFMMVCHWAGIEAECRDHYKNYLTKSAYLETLCKE